MNRIFGILLVGSLLVGCPQLPDERVSADAKIEFNQALADELSEMKVVDQLVASNAYPPESYSDLTLEEWEAFKDKTYRAHQKRAEEIFHDFGFVGFDLAGEAGSSDFWIIVQHSDHDSKFQNEVLKKMKVEVDRGNADSKEYGLLVDRVKLNTGESQIYGTQVDFDHDTCQAYPKNLADRIGVNARRKEIGLEPLEIYLNEMTQMHFEMNKQFYSERGVTEPKLYETE
ncbi:DUF6624 domain-containing protein [Mariniblastus fucicola]|uniref:Lipoprotein n=1 Tax=Mariniblastus fucicola TaxID=980251 RepID=A0A5B9P291_9BACT|nr:DUF6624 domain-containing protein [Mariniblastus fucicola]QEG20448.1 hypothetical protein MFFC18_02960 [Mariniblastus fucicola]